MHLLVTEATAGAGRNGVWHGGAGRRLFGVPIMVRGGFRPGPSFFAGMFGDPDRMTMQEPARRGRRAGRGLDGPIDSARDRIWPRSGSRKVRSPG